MLSVSASLQSSEICKSKQPIGIFVHDTYYIICFESYTGKTHSFRFLSRFLLQFKALQNLYVASFFAKSGAVLFICG